MFHGKGTLLFENGAKYEAVWNEGIAAEVINRFILIYKKIRGLLILI